MIYIRFERKFIAIYVWSIFVVVFLWWQVVERSNGIGLEEKSVKLGKTLYFNLYWFIDLINVLYYIELVIEQIVSALQFMHDMELG